MSKLTKNQRIDRLVACLRTQGIKMRELEVKLEALEEWSNGADDMLTELNHALPDPEYDAKCEENAVAVQESLDRHAVRLGLVKPKLKQLDQSVFDGLDEKWRFAAVDGNKGFPVVYEHEPEILESEGYYNNRDGLYEDLEHMKGYDTTNWQNSLIERKELTGSDLCRAMLARGDVCVPCFTSWDGDTEAIADKSICLVHQLLPEEPKFHAGLEDFYFAVPINTVTGEPLTAADVGL